MKKIIHKAESRGFANHGWLQANHSFSFASWQSPDRNNFGALRVLNDDIIAPKMGFGTHPHDNMEIITIPLKGVLKHRDNMANDWQQVLPGEVQVMSAGTGDVKLSRIDLSEGKTFDYTLKSENHGVYIMNISGDVKVEGEHLNSRDAIGISEVECVNISSDTDSELLFIEVPMINL